MLVSEFLIILLAWKWGLWISQIYLIWLYLMGVRRSNDLQFRGWWFEWGKKIVMCNYQREVLVAFFNLWWTYDTWSRGGLKSVVVTGILENYAAGWNLECNNVSPTHGSRLVLAVVATDNTIPMRRQRRTSMQSFGGPRRGIEVKSMNCQPSPNLLLNWWEL